jgi:hypothetical protein
MKVIPEPRREHYIIFDKTRITKQDKFNKQTNKQTNKTKQKTTNEKNNKINKKTIQKMYACLRITITFKIYVARHVSRINFIRYAQSRMIGTPNIFLNGSN